MPRFGFVGDEAVLAEQNMAQTPQREEPPPVKHVKPTEQRSLTTETFAEPDAKAKIAPPEGGDLETLVEQETAHEVDVDLAKEVSDETVYTEEKEKAVIVSTVRVPVVGSEEDRYLLDEVATNWTTLLIMLHTMGWKSRTKTLKQRESRIVPTESTSH